MFVLDGSKLNSNNNLKTHPIDYWYNVKNNIDEMEDRVYSKKPTLDTKAVRECHILIDHSSEEVLDTEKKYVDEIRKAGILVYVYTEDKDFQLLNKKKTVSLDSLKIGGAKKEVRWTPSLDQKQLKLVSSVVGMINAKKYSDLTNYINDYFSMVENTKWMLDSDIKSLKYIIMDNSGGDQPLYDETMVITSYMNKHKLKDIESLYNNLIQKRKDIMESV
jgi:hypothetical protein